MTCAYVHIIHSTHYKYTWLFLCIHNNYVRTSLWTSQTFWPNLGPSSMVDEIHTWHGDLRIYVHTQRGKGWWKYRWLRGLVFLNHYHRVYWADSWEIVTISLQLLNSYNLAKCTCYERVSLLGTCINQHPHTLDMSRSIKACTKQLRSHTTSILGDNPKCEFQGWQNHALLHNSTSPYSIKLRYITLSSPAILIYGMLIVNW